MVVAGGASLDEQAVTNSATSSNHAVRTGLLIFIVLLVVRTSDVDCYNVVDSAGRFHENLVLVYQGEEVFGTLDGYDLLMQSLFRGTTHNSALSE